MEKIILISSEELTNMIRTLVAEERNSLLLEIRKLQPQDSIEEIVTIKEACKLLRVSRCTVYKFIKERSLPFKKIGGKTFLYRSDLRSFLNHKSKIA